MNHINPIKKVISVGLSLVMLFTLSSTAFAAPAYTDAPIEGVSNQDFSRDMALEIFRKYLNEKNVTANTLTSEEATMLWEGFAQYAVDNGYIADTPEQRAGITVEAGRALISLCADICSEKYPTASMLLEHSLHDNPEDIVYGSSSSYAQQIEDSEEFQEILDDAIEEAKTLTYITSSRISGSVRLDSTTDLLLAYRSIDYVRWIKRPGITDNLWHMEVTFRDTYDFDSDGWSDVWDELQVSGLVGAAGEVLTMLAATAVDMGIIEEFEIEVVVETDFRA